MKTISLIQPNDWLYPQVVAFANQVYERELGSGATYQPTWFFTLLDNGVVRGCLGLNDVLVSKLFRNDVRLQQWYDGKTERMCDQAFFAVDRCSFAVPVLISVAAAFAESVGIRYIVYAGVSVSCRTIDSLGFSVEVLGQTDITIVPEAMQRSLHVWQQQCQPVTCVLDTTGAQAICVKTCTRLQHRIRVDVSLLQHIHPVAECV